VGSADIMAMGGTADSESIRDKVMTALSMKFRPEFLNRIDEFVTFNPLGMEQLVPIVTLELSKVSKRLAEKGLKLSVTDGAKSWIAESGYDPVFGARPLKRTIQRSVETPIAKAILGGMFAKDTTVMLDARPGDSQLTLSSIPPSSSSSSPSASSSSSSTSNEGKSSSTESWVENIMQ